MAKRSGRKRKAEEDASAAHATNQLADAEALLNAGSTEEGQALFKSIIESDADDQVVGVAKYTLAMVNLCKGDSASADGALTSLGLRYRLHESVFVSESNGKTVESSSVANHVQVVDDAFAKPVWTHLCDRLNHTSSPFWSEHRYGEPDVGYFSYAFSDCATAKPRHCIEAWIQSHLLPVVQAAFPDKAASIRHAEWWAHSRDQISGHQLHYDTDETRLTRDHSLHYPLVSTVWYLTPGASGAPTLITDKKFGQDALQSHGYLVYPEENRLAMFDGRLLHGVIPHFLPRGDSTERLTLMVGFWDKDVATNDYVVDKPTANMMLPLKVDSETTWPAHFTQTWSSSDTATALKKPGPIFAVEEPLWVDLHPPADAMTTHREDSVFVGKYFLHDLAQLDSDVAGLLAEPSEEDREWLVKHQDDKDFEPRLAQTLCVVFEWMKRGDEFLDLAGDFLLELTAHCPAAVRVVRATKAWAELVTLLLETAEAKETIAAIAWNILKGPDPQGQEDMFHTPELVEALMDAGESDEECVAMVCGALAYCLDIVPNRKYVMQGLASHLASLYQDRDEDDEFAGAQDIQDTEDAIAFVLKGSGSEVKKLTSVLKSKLGSYYSDAAAKFK
ncbi:unnamed protein product [Aphanomyces euteiches]|uniref:Uncharacterized protein n=1 Tax=Aphanomyces euteiches TaxID=100861 RepID=A0A6G0XD31_9STRA|nr:hypothetical protein Ae201684_006057 [Aphanomyces euteiches]KAH9068714.1 hypothetical protein Ae201684P_004415 [Aphanomyces euteiches]KAH9156317.1 hypothetical protein AeRB84_001779 [Aphanomyces euteiches]